MDKFLELTFNTLITLSYRKTSQLICRVNQLTGFYMKETLTVTEFRKQFFSIKAFGEYI